MIAIFPSLIAQATGIAERQVKACLELLEGGCTIPFISRYRKEATGSLDEVQISAISDHYDRLVEMQKRKATILTTIEAQGKLTDELHQRIEAVWDATELEDIYLPYRPKRRTRAMVAREKGLEPLALFLMDQAARLDQRPATADDVDRELSGYVDPGRGVESAAEALRGAQDIIAELVAEDERARGTVRRNFDHDAVITSRRVQPSADKAGAAPVADDVSQKYRDYFDRSEPLRRCASHRLLAMRRGEAEGVLRLSISGDDGLCLDRLMRQFVRSQRSAASPLVADAVTDGFRRLLKPSIETEYMQLSKARADQEAIRIFVRNLEQLLMAPPLGQKRVLALDPGFRTGCKLVVLDAQGGLVHHDVIFPHPPKSRFIEAMETVEDCVRRYGIEAVSIGNGTASRETEEFIEGLDLGGIPVFVVSEDGASIYSASKVARDEFPDQDVTVRGAVSIGRRLMDPLAELVKIDPSSIGVGQYQKDVNQAELKRALDHTVVACVNKVGVDVNTASRHLLTYVSGLGPTLAQNIVDYRAAHGPFAHRSQLRDVPRMGPKAFEQSAGFLRIAGGDNPLDNSAVHPESYPIVGRMAADLGVGVADLIGAAGAPLRARIDLGHYVTDATAGAPAIGLPSLRDIMAELEKPGRDPRGPLEAFAFDASVKTIDDLAEGMVLPGIVTNVTNFGAFVDIGVHVQGLVHVSEMERPGGGAPTAPADGPKGRRGDRQRQVANPAACVSLHQHVMVRVKEVDLARRRISLSMRGL